MALPKRLAAVALFDYAVAALARRSLTATELRKRLEQRAARPEDVHEVLNRLKDLGYLDDARLAESYARFRRDYEGLGRMRVLRDLERRGVERNVAEKTVGETFREADELDLVRAQIRKRLGSRAAELPLSDRKQLASLFRALARAGFSSARIVEGLQEISSDTDWLEAFSEHQSEQDEVVD
ncbi:MAG: RecX family transcriptional regulator [Bryobacterales bacterium]